MHSDLTRDLACPSCRGPYALEPIDERRGRVLGGGLICTACRTVVPLCAGFALFPETRPYDGAWTRADVDRVEAETMGDPARYAAFVRDKHERPSRDAYAVFQPFNEATRSFLPLVPLLRRRLRPGDLILDLWCRTGWSGELLAALFPEQRVVSLWEGNSDVLGYRGFRFWLGEFERAANLDVVFRSPAKPLPFADGSVALVHGLDALHRYPQDVLVAEVLRVLRRGGAAVFPHVHLTNSEPEPYFDRGCLQRHGREYRDDFARLLSGSDRRAFVLSERALFEDGDGRRLVDDAETHHYNALVAILPADAEGETLAVEPSGEPEPTVRPVINRMWTLDLDLGLARVDAMALDGAVGRLLERHPIYRDHLARWDPLRLTQEECEFLYLADRCLDLEEIGRRTHRAAAEVARIAAGLAARDLVELRPVSRSMAVLQRFYAEQTMIEPQTLQTPRALLQESFRRFAPRPLLIVDGDGSVFTYAEASEIVDRVRSALRRDGIAPGDTVCMCAPLGAEAILVTWACLEMGVLFVPLDWSTAAVRLSSVLAWLRPKLVFADGGPARAVSAEWPCVVFDEGEGEGDETPPATPFSEWLEADDTASGSEAEIDPEGPAVLLQTSGTSGEPKFVELSHAALYRTGMRLVRSFHWRSDDVLLSTGDLHAMSGLRNPCLAAVAAGAAVLTVGVRERRNPMALAEAVQRHQATLLTTTPAILHLLSRYEGRLPPAALSSLRQVMSTGSPLSPALADAFEARFGVAVLDYYGLTETAGGNVIVRPEDACRRPPGSIGRPLGCVAQIVDDDGVVLGPGMAGELRIFTDNLMRGYRMQTPAATAVRGGWFYTGDIAVRDEEGFLTLLSRRRDVVKDLRGDLVYPAEVERVLLSHPLLGDAGVCGFTAASGEERLAAFVVPREAVADGGALADELRRWVLEHLGPYRVPSRVEIVESLPRLADGALLRRVLAARCT